MIDKELLEILACPETHQSLTEATGEALGRINARIEAGGATNKGGKAVTEPLAGALLREDGKVAYPIRDGIPILLVDEGIVLE